MLDNCIRWICWTGVEARLKIFGVLRVCEDIPRRDLPMIWACTSSILVPFGEWSYHLSSFLPMR
jgi:hypothetical protein